MSNNAPAALRPAAAFRDTKPHYLALDGLRGVAALVVIVYHVFECFTASPMPHGYLAVDLFFVLSGFVIGYAYDDRWQRGLTTWGFLRRRLIRLHPMVVIAAVIGAVTFLIQGSVKWDGTSVPLGWVMTAMLMTMLMIPSAPGAASDVRGNNEIFPLNGPAWSLFFEYIGNVLYVLLLRRLPTRWLAAVATLTGCALVGIALRDGYLGVGWSFIDGGFWAGLVRMLFPYTVGMLLARLLAARGGRIKGFKQSDRTFWLCSLLVLAVGLTPALGGEEMPWVNGLFEALCVVVLFPAIVLLGAVGSTDRGERVQRFLGDLSYPLYAIHYPFMYLFYAHIGFNGELVPVERMREVWPEALLLVAGCLTLAWLALRFYDLPVRRWLSKL